MQRFKVVTGSASWHCCFEATVVDTSKQKYVGRLGGSKTWDKWIEVVDIKNKDLVIAYANGEIDSVTAIYKAMRRARS